MCGSSLLTSWCLSQKPEILMTKLFGFYLGHQKLLGKIVIKIVFLDVKYLLEDRFLEKFREIFYLTLKVS